MAVSGFLTLVLCAGTTIAETGSGWRWYQNGRVHPGGMDRTEYAVILWHSQQPLEIFVKWENRLREGVLYPKLGIRSTWLQQAWLFCDLMQVWLQKEKKWWTYCPQKTNKKNLLEPRTHNLIKPKSGFFCGLTGKFKKGRTREEPLRPGR